MSQSNQDGLGHEVARILIKTVIAVVGLLLIRAILGSLPMLKDANPIIVGGSTPQSSNEAMQQLAARWFQNGPSMQAAQDIARQYSAGLIYPISIAYAIVDTLIFATLIFSAMGFNGLIRA